jgi:hypothetical protein
MSSLLRILKRSLGYSGSGHAEVVDDASALLNGLISPPEVEGVPEEALCCIEAGLFPPEIESSADGLVSLDREPSG